MHYIISEKKIKQNKQAPGLPRLIGPVCSPFISRYRPSTCVEQQLPSYKSYQQTVQNTLAYYAILDNLNVPQIMHNISHEGIKYLPCQIHSRNCEFECLATALSSAPLCTTKTQIREPHRFTSEKVPNIIINFNGCTKS